MGTEVHSKMYLSGYYPGRDLNESTVNGSLPSHHENKTFGQYYDIFSTRPAMDGYMGYDKEQFRQIILRHENIFRHQLHEMHRLYKIQTDMMNEVRSKEPHYVKQNGRLQSSMFPFPSDNDTLRWHDSSLSMVDCKGHMPSTSGAGIIQSHFSTMNTKNMQAGCGSNHNGSRFMGHESIESKCKQLQRRLFDLELPADKYINDEEEGQVASLRPGMEIHPPNWNGVASCEKQGNSSTFSGVHSSCNGDALSSNKRNRGFTDLNEPFPVEEASGAASVDIAGNNICSKEEIQTRDQSANLYLDFQRLARDISQSSCKEKDEDVSLYNLNLEKERRQNGFLPNNVNHGQPVSKRGSPGGGLYLPALCESSQTGHWKSHEPARNRKEQTKKTIFGVEISERDDDASVMACDTPFLKSLVPQPSMVSDSSSITSLKKLPGSFRPNLMSLHENPSFNTFPESSKSSVTLMHAPEVTQDRSLVNSTVRSVVGSGAEPPYQNGQWLVSQLESKESKVCYSSTGFDYSSGISDRFSASEQACQRSPANNSRGTGWLVNMKSAGEVNLNNAPPKSYQINATSDSKCIFVDGQSREENRPGGLSWLGAVSKERDGSCQMNLGSLQNYSQQFVNKAETMKGPTKSFIQDSSSVTFLCDMEGRKVDGDCSSNRKMLGVPIVDNHISKDLPSASCSSKLTCCDSEINGANSVKVGLLHTDLNNDPPIPSESEEIPNMDNLVVENGLGDCSANIRNHIDLNVSVTEEETQHAHFSPRTKTNIAVEIDLEAPVVVDTEMDITFGGEFVENKHKGPLDSLKDESININEGFVRTAAEALVDISSFKVHNLLDDATCHQLEASLCDSLHWFAEIISSCRSDIGNDVGSGSAAKDSTDLEHSIPHGIDYFEYMTLNLTEFKVEEYSYKPQASENTIDEITLSRRPRRGQGKRGRQRKDFQRDILPSLASLSRNDVTEDLHTIEGLVRATGGTWLSGLSQRNSPRRKGGRGRKRAGDSSASPTVIAVSPPETHQPKCGELGLEETRLTGWGKRTRRPPRQRCPINQPLLPQNN